MKHKISNLKIYFLIIIPFLIWLSFSHLHAQSSPVGFEYDVKAGFICNFARLTKWQPDAFEKPNSPIMICFISDNPEADMLFTLNNKPIRGRKIIVKKCKIKSAFTFPFFDSKDKAASDKKITQGFHIPFFNLKKKKKEEEDNMENLEKCHILFFALSDNAIIKEKLNYIRNKNILTIGETENFTNMCGIINFFTEENRLRFKVNLPAAKHAGLELSSQLLGSAATIVKEECE